MMCDELGMPLDFVITAGQESDYTQAIRLIGRQLPAHIIADRGYDSNEIVDFIKSRGKTAVIPARENRLKTRPVDKIAYRNRNRIERLFGHLKQFRRLATRFEKSIENYASIIFLACSWIWLNQM